MGTSLEMYVGDLQIHKDQVEPCLKALEAWAGEKFDNLGDAFWRLCDLQCGEDAQEEGHLIVEQFCGEKAHESQVEFLYRIAPFVADDIFLDCHLWQR